MKKFAVITGASNGIGYELAKVFAQEGYDLLIASESDRIHEVAPDFEALGAKVERVQVDLARYDQVERLYERIKSTGRSIDAVAINAGVGVGGDFARETELAAELNLIELNVSSTVHLTKRIVKDLIAQGHGRILFTSSIAATMPGAYEAVYGASKAFVQSFAEAIRNELKDTGITITALMPGPTETNFFHRAGMDDTRVGAQKKDDPAKVAQQGYAALMAGKDHVIAGSLKNRLMAGLAHILPQRASAEGHRQLSQPGTGDPAKAAKERAKKAPKPGLRTQTATGTKSKRRKAA